MAGCSARKANGEPCKGTAVGSHGYCWAHAPEHAEARRKNASRAGKSKPSRDLLQTRTQLQELADRVLAGEVDRADASVAGQLLNIKLRTIELERRLKETEELEKRLEELEETLEDQSQHRGSPYGRRA
jgi:hypothetical protein